MLIGSAVTPVKDVTRELQAAVRTLEDPAPAEFAREFQAANVHRPPPEAFFERAVAESLKLPARVWKSALDGLLGVDDAADLARITAPTLLIWGTGRSSSRGRKWKVWRRRSPISCTARTSGVRSRIVAANALSFAS